MAYATPAEFEDKFGSAETLALSNVDNPGATSINLVAIEQALEDVAAEIDGYVGARYTLPLSSVPATLRAASCDMARYRLDKNLQREDVRQRYEDWIKFLRDVAKGVASLGIDQSAPPLEPRGESIGTRPRFFNLRGY